MGKLYHQLSPRTSPALPSPPLPKPAVHRRRGAAPGPAGAGERRPTRAQHTSAKARAALHPKYAFLSRTYRDFRADWTPAGVPGTGSGARSSPDAMKGAFCLPNATPGTAVPDGLQHLRRERLPRAPTVFFCAVPLASAKPGLFPTTSTCGETPETRPQGQCHQTPAWLRPAPAPPTMLSTQTERPGELSLLPARRR